MRLGGGARKLVKAKRRANQMKVYKTANASKPKTSVIEFSTSTRYASIVCNPIEISKKNVSANFYFCSKDITPEEEEEEAEKARDTFLFRQGRLPRHRQMFYQLKNIWDTDAQLLISKSRSDRKECDEKNGWFQPGMDAKLRTILTENIKKHCLEGDADSMSMISSATGGGQSSTVGDSLLFDEDEGMDIFEDEDLEEGDNDGGQDQDSPQQPSAKLAKHTGS